MHASNLTRISLGSPIQTLCKRPQVRVVKARPFFICSTIVASSMTDNPSKKAKTDVFSRHSVCLVLDYGSQYTQLIARRVRENGVLSVLLPGDVDMVRCCK